MGVFVDGLPRPKHMGSINIEVSHSKFGLFHINVPIARKHLTSLPGPLLGAYPVLTTREWVLSN